MKRVVFSAIIFFVVFGLKSLTIVLPNDNIIEGDFLVLKDNLLYLESNKNLYIIPSDIVSKILNDDNEVLDWDKVKEMKKRRINYNRYLNTIELNEKNFREITTGFQKYNQETITIILRDSTFLTGYIVGNEANCIYYVQLGNPQILIIEKDLIASFVKDEEEVTTEIMSTQFPVEMPENTNTEIVKLNFSRKSTDDSQIADHFVPYGQKKRVTLDCYYIGVDIGLSHRLSYQGVSSDFNLTPAPYFKSEIINISTFSYGFGVGIQPWKSLRDYNETLFYYLSAYLTASFQLVQETPVHFKANFGANLFWGNEDYTGTLTTKAGIYLAAGPQFEISKRAVIEILYTMNQGKINIVTVTNHSLSIGVGIYSKKRK